MEQETQTSNKYFDILDKIITSKHTQDSNYLNNLTLDNIYTKSSWYYTLKKQSPVLTKLIDNKMYFDSINVSIDKVLMTICTLINYSNYVGIKSTLNMYIKVPDKLCVMRNQTSRDKTSNILQILSNLNIIKILYDAQGMQFKLNLALLKTDKYVQARCKTFLKSDYKCIINLEDEGSFYFYKYCDHTIYKQQRELLLGLTLAYNELLSNNNKFFYNYRQDTDGTGSIIYAEVPIRILASIEGKTEQQVKMYYNQLCEHSNYIKKHDYVYTDIDLKGVKHVSKITKHITSNHYGIPDYTKYYLSKYEKMNTRDGDSLEVGHPRVTPYSCIIFVENLLSTKTGKNVQKNYFYYEDLLLRHLKGDDVLRTVYRNNLNALPRKNKKQINEKEQIIKDVIGSEEDIQGNVISCDKLKYKNNISGRYIKRQHIWGDITKRSAESLCKFVKNMQVHMLKCPEKDFNNQIQETYKGIQGLIDRKVYLLQQHYNCSDMYEEYFSTRLLKTDEVIQHYGLYNEVEPKFKQLIKQSDLFKNYCISKGIFEEQEIQQSLESFIDMSMFKDKQINDTNKEVYDNGKYITDNTVNIDSEDFGYLNLMMI